MSAPDAAGSHYSLLLMGVSSFIWRGVLAFDRIGSRIPQLVQIWLVELFFVMPLAFFIGKVLDVRGALGIPGTGGSVPGVSWGALVLALALISGFFFVRGLVPPRFPWCPLPTRKVMRGNAFGSRDRSRPGRCTGRRREQAGAPTTMRAQAC